MIVDKFNRNNFYSYNDVDGLNEPDLMNNKFKDFKFIRQFSTYTTTIGDIQRPDLISYNVYGRVNYWWIIMKVNSIEDIWNDITSGMVLQIPNIRDIEDYVLKSKNFGK
jgi:hypothetical protein